MSDKKEELIEPIPIGKLLDNITFVSELASHLDNRVVRVAVASLKDHQVPTASILKSSDSQLAKDMAFLAGYNTALNDLMKLTRVRTRTKPHTEWE